MMISFDFPEWVCAIDAHTLGILSVAVILAAVWIFFKIIRKMIAIAFLLCLVYLGLHCCGIDALSLFLR